MKSLKPVIVLTLLITAFQTDAGGSVKHVSKASKHSAIALSHGALFSIKVASGAVAIPLLIAGGAATVSTAAGKSLMENAVEEAPLKITEITVTADPAPEVVMKSKQKEDR